MGKKAKNVVLIMVDQLRYDALAINGNEIVSTPNLDQLASNGKNFTQAYSVVPSCIPARATLMTGLKADRHGKVGYEDGGNWNYTTTLAGEFVKRGYYAKCVGKMHVYPPRRLCGYHHIELHDGYLHHNRKYKKEYSTQFANSDDYLMFLKEHLGVKADLIDLGLDCNSWVARPWPYDEMLHPTNWVTTRGIDFLRTRDTTMPFFLKLSFTRPHSPLDPPTYYYNMYEQKLRDLPDVKIGEWVKNFVYSQTTHSTIAKMGKISPDDLRRAISAYYGLITHIDHQIGRFMMALEEYDLLDDTIIMFVSDHGDQLGEHHLFRKGFPYQGSIHVPFIIDDPSLRNNGVNEIDAVVELCDVLPTLISLVSNGDQISDIDGKDLSGLMQGKQKHVRDYLHGEHELGDFSTQFILTDEWKYIWYTKTGQEQLFNLVADPNEEVDCINNPEYAPIVHDLKSILLDVLQEREEGFVKDGKLIAGIATKTTLEEKDGIFNNS